MLLQELAPEVLLALTPIQKTQLTAISEWDLEDIGVRVQERLQWPRELVAEAVGEYRKFIALVVLNPDKDYGMSDAVDEVWHQHILSTRDYSAMCAATTGEMIHHEQPAVRGSIDPEFADAGSATLEDMGRAFSGAPSRLWDRPTHAVAKCKSIKLRAV
jgi:hypothetical protein